MKVLGRVEYFNPVRAFGFVVDAEEPRTKRFFHKTHIVYGTPLTGRLCMYTTGETTKGKVALDIEILGGAE